ncbi:unnamed protein product [Didymodactylos carnosus]|uniref:Uncharacterized protein n=1 Tax=Didymodactylos carnosus TaxID=1234261 RepID=A0A815I9N5_9BILA|nr:unnamed protein product [Didymodactylos carnosus]CAF1362539.1 unnamed protein product [Didymodactylos carnosus]CAF3754346.1 unnamed protein product [Didymodactylos carnosus]CAF4242373.1 unnamed protein product [Didymodactylos carnosus]
MSSICALGVIVRYLIRIFQVLATIYSWLDFSVGIVNQGICSNYHPTDNLYEETNGSSTDDIKSLLDYYGTGSNLIAVDVCIDIPRYICLAYISIKLAELSIKKIRARMILKQKSISTSLSLSREEKQLLSYMKHFIEARYVRYLFVPVDRRPKSKILLSRIIPKKIYTIRDDFHYSLRVLSVYASAFILLFFMTTNFCVKVIPSLATLHQSLTTIFNLSKKHSTATIFNELFGNNKFPLPAFVGPRNLFQVYRSDITELPHRATLNTVSLATSNFHFSDYSPLGRKLERFDSGFSAYVEYIYMEREHAHPVMLCFASYLYLNVKLNQTTAK